MLIPYLSRVDIEDIKNTDKMVYAWGVSAFTRYILEKLPLEVAGFIDGLKQKQTVEEAFTLPVYHKSHILGQEKRCVIIIFADIRLFGERILSEIKKLGEFTVYQLPPPQIKTEHLNLPQCKQLVTPPTKIDTPKVNEKVCLCIPNLARGGAERQILYLAKGLMMEGKDVVLIIWKEGSNPSWIKEFKEMGGTITMIDSPRKNYTFVNTMSKNVLAEYLSKFFMPYEIYLIVQIYMILKKENPSHFVSYMDQPNIFGGIAAYVAGVQNCIMSSCSAKPDIGFSLPTYLSEQNIASMYKLLLQSNRFVLTANAVQSAKNYAKWIGEEIDAIPVIRNAVEIDDSQLAYADIRKNNGIPVDAFLISCAMRFAPPKNPQRFVNIVAKFMTHNPTAWAIMMGDGKLMSDVKKLIEEKGLKQRIVLTGEVDNVAQHLFESDVFIQSSDIEGYPNALVEAIACECCVIATNVGGTREAIPENYPYNPLFAPEDEGIAVQLLETIANRKNKLLPSIVDLRHQVERNNSITSLAQKTLLASKYK